MKKEDLRNRFNGVALEYVDIEPIYADCEKHVIKIDSVKKFAHGLSFKASHCKKCLREFRSLE